MEEEKEEEERKEVPIEVDIDGVQGFGVNSQYIVSRPRSAILGNHDKYKEEKKRWSQEESKGGGGVRRSQMESGVRWRRRGRRMSQEGTEKEIPRRLY